MSLTVIAKDIIVWPLLVIGAGIFLAWLTKRYVGVVRVVWSLLKQEAELGELYKASQKQFSEAAQGKPFASYTIAKDVDGTRRSIVAVLEKLQKSWVTSIESNRDYKAAVVTLADLQQQLTAWGNFGDELQTLEQDLDNARSKIDGDQMIPRAANPDIPPFMAVAEKLLRGRELRASELTQIRQAVSSATLLCGIWGEVVVRAKGLTLRFSELQKNKVPETQREKLASAETALIGAWQHLWEVQSAGDLPVITSAGGDLDSAQIGLAGIEADRARPSTASSLTVSSKMFLTASTSEGTPETSFESQFVDSAQLAASDTRRPGLLNRAIRFGDTGSVVLAVMLATLTGLSTNYFGKPFGTAQDYVVLFLWAAGTKAALDMLSAVLDRFAAPSTSQTSN